MKMGVTLTDEVSEYLKKSAEEAGTTPESLVSSIINCSVLEHIGALLQRDMGGTVVTRVEALRAMVEVAKRVKEEKAADIKRVPLAGWRDRRSESYGTGVLNAITLGGLQVTRTMSLVPAYNRWIADHWTTTGDNTVTSVPDTDMGRREWVSQFGYPGEPNERWSE